MSQDRPQDYSIQEWLASIDASLEGIGGTLERIADRLDRPRKSLPTAIPDEDEIHYRDGTIRPLSEMISRVEQTIPKGEGRKRTPGLKVDNPARNEIAGYEHED